MFKSNLGFTVHIYILTTFDIIRFITVSGLIAIFPPRCIDLWLCIFRIFIKLFRISTYN